MLVPDVLSDAAARASTAILHGYVAIALVAGAVVFALIVGCARSPAPRSPRARDGWRASFAATTVPGIILAALAALGASSRRSPGATPPDAITVKAFARRWAWEFHYPDGSVLTNELMLPRGRAVRIVATSRDVAHSLVVPALGVRLRALPGRFEETWFRTTPGGSDTQTTYFCGEYCGVAPPPDPPPRGSVAGAGHHSMIGWVWLLTGPKYEERVQTHVQRWPRPGRSEMLYWGEILYRSQQCSLCHSVDGSLGTGPTWRGLFGRRVALADGRVVTADEEYLVRSIVDPRADVVRGYEPVMPSYKAAISESAIEAIVLYIATIDGRDARVTTEGSP